MDLFTITGVLSISVDTKVEFRFKELRSLLEVKAEVWAVVWLSSMVQLL